jgi:hypothetical protein
VAWVLLKGNGRAQMGTLEDWRERITKVENDLKEICPKYEDLLRLAAGLMCECQDLRKEAEKWEEEWNANQLVRTCSEVPQISKTRESYILMGL